MNTNENKIEANKLAWGKVAQDHYNHFKELLSNEDFKLNPIVEEELGDVRGKTILHLQCNTGADSIHLARKGAIVTGVDLVPENIYYAKKLATDFNLSNTEFIESMGGSARDLNGFSYYPELEGKLPLVLSLMAQKK